MNREPIDIVRIIRRLRGGSQAYLVKGHDGLHYVAKFAGNPQGTRTLINEWFARQLFCRFGISTPPVRILRLPPSISKELAVEMEKTQLAVEPGLHFGSQCPNDPSTRAIYDFLPRKVLSRVVNPEDFAKTLVLDLFLGQTDTRQAIFAREGSRGASHLRAYMIDHGGTLGGSLWQLPKNTLEHLYFNRAVYSLCNLPRECEQTLHHVSALAYQHLHQLGESVPSVWFARNDQAEWARLLRQLSVRKSQLPDLVHQCSQAWSLEQSGWRNLVSSQEDRVQDSRFEVFGR